MKSKSRPKPPKKAERAHSTRFKNPFRRKKSSSKVKQFSVNIESPELESSARITGVLPKSHLKTIPNNKISVVTFEETSEDTNVTSKKVFLYTFEQVNVSFVLI